MEGTRKAALNFSDMLGFNEVQTGSCVSGSKHEIEPTGRAGFPFRLYSLCISCIIHCISRINSLERVNFYFNTYLFFVAKARWVDIIRFELPRR